MSNQNCHTCVRVLFWMNLEIYSHKKADFVRALHNASASLPNHFVCSRHAGFAEWEQKLQITGLPWWIGLQVYRPEDDLCRSNRLQMQLADFGERLCDIVKKNVNIIVLFVAGLCFQAIPLKTLWLFMFSQGCILQQHNYFVFYVTKRFLSIVDIHVVSVASSTFLALNFLIPYLGKIIFRASDWKTVSAKKKPCIVLHT